jgi:hypothetical protein
MLAKDDTIHVLPDKAIPGQATSTIPCLSVSLVLDKNTIPALDRGFSMPELV